MQKAFQLLFQIQTDQAGFWVECPSCHLTLYGQSAQIQKRLS